MRISIPLTRHTRMSLGPAAIAILLPLLAVAYAIAFTVWLIITMAKLVFYGCRSAYRALRQLSGDNPGSRG